MKKYKNIFKENIDYNGSFKTKDRLYFINTINTKFNEMELKCQQNF